MDLRTSHFGILVVYAALLLAQLSQVSAKCLYTETKCQCAMNPPGHICLRYHSGPPGKELCESYECNPGYRCDCSGTKICDIGPCSGSMSTAETFAYRPITSGATASGHIIPCERFSKTTCAIPNMNEPSVSPEPSLSSRPSPSASAAPDMPVDSGPSPTPTPLAVLPLGAECASPKVPGTTCQQDLACDCAGVCARQMMVHVRAIGDDEVKPYICGTALQPATENHYTPGEWKYTGPCVTHFIFETENWGGRENAMGAGLKMQITGVGATDWIPTKIGTGGMVAEDPSDLSFLTDPRFEFESSAEWHPVVKQTHLLRYWQISDFLSSIGNADLWALRNSDDLEKVKFYYMMPNPACPKLW